MKGEQIVKPIIYSDEHFAVERSVVQRILEKDADMPKQFLKNRVTDYLCSESAEKGRAYTVEQIRELFELAEMGRENDGVTTVRI